MWLSIVFLIGQCFSIYVDCQCTLPLTEGTWFTSGRGTWNVGSNGTVIENFKTSLSVTQPTSNVTCNSQSGALYILGTTIQAFSDVVINVYTCIDIRTTDSSPSKYLIHFVTPVDIGTSDRFTSDISNACNNTNYITALNTLVILQNGSEASAVTTLPNVIRGNYSVNYTDTDGTDVTGSTMDSCSDVTIMEYNKSDSARTVSFSNTGILLNMYSVQDGSVYYVYTYNNESSVDGATTYRFACWVFSYSTPGVVGTVFPEECQSNQNATSVPAGGQTFQFLAYVVCPDEDDDDDGLSTWLIVLIVILCCLFVAAVFIIVICCLKYKGKPKDATETPPKSPKTIKADTFATFDETEKNDSQNDNWHFERMKSITFKNRNSDGPMTRWSKIKHRRRIRRQKSASKSSTADKPTTEYIVQPEGQFMYRRMYVSMAPTSLLFTGSPNSGSDANPQEAPETTNANSIGMPKRAKTMIETKPKKSKYPIYAKQKQVISSDITKQRLENLMILRTKTFHDFSRDFDKLNPFPDSTKTNDRESEEKKDGRRTKPLERESSIAKSRPSTEKSRPSTTDGLGEQYDKPKPKQPARRTRSETTKLSQTLVSFSYNSPYAMTTKQKEHMAQRDSWIRTMKQIDQEEEKRLMESRKQTNTEAYKVWLKNKAARTKSVKRSYVINRKPKKTSTKCGINAASNETTASVSEGVVDVADYGKKSSTSDQTHISSGEKAMGFQKETNVANSITNDKVTRELTNVEKEQ